MEQQRKKHKYITRIDYNSHGYWCRIHRLGVNKFFADSKYGGEIEALNAALLWRNKQTGGVLEEESETGVKGLNISRRKSKDGKTLYYLSVYIKRGNDRIQAMRALKKPINKVIWDAAKIIAEARAKYDGEDEQEVAAKVYATAYARISKIIK